MGTQDGKALEKRDKKRGAKRERLERLRGSGGASSGEASWGDVDPRLVSRLVWVVTRAGGAVMLSVTSDGGALAITFYDNGERERVYLPKNVDMEVEFEGLIALWLD